MQLIALDRLNDYFLVICVFISTKLQPWVSSVFYAIQYNASVFFLTHFFYFLVQSSNWEVGWQLEADTLKLEDGLGKYHKVELF